MSKAVKRVVYFLPSLLFCSQLYAHGKNLYQNNVSPSVLAAINWGKQINEFRQAGVSFQIRTDKELNLENLRTQAADALLSGKLKGIKQDVDFQLHGTLNHGECETTFSLSRLKGLSQEWEAHYGTMGLFKAFQPSVKQLLFHEDEGFSTQLRLTRDFPYLLVFNAQEVSSSGKIENRARALTEARKFIASLEKDERSKIVLSLNKSQLPVTVLVPDEGKEPTFLARHPMHEITWQPKAGFQSYSLIDSYADVKNFPEVREIMRDATVKDFVLKNESSARVNMKGNKKEGYSFVLTAEGGQKKLVGKVLKGIVSLNTGL